MLFTAVISLNAAMLTFPHTVSRSKVSLCSEAVFQLGSDYRVSHISLYSLFNYFKVSAKRPTFTSGPENQCVQVRTSFRIAAEKTAVGTLQLLKIKCLGLKLRL